MDKFKIYLDKVKDNKSVIVKLILLLIPISIGVLFILEGLSPKFNNSNNFDYPRSEQDSQYIILTVNTDEPNKVNYNALSNGLKTTNKKQNFILSNYDDKLSQFIKDNKRQEFLGLSKGAPKIIVSKVAYNASLSSMNGQNLTVDGNPLFDGYSTVKDANQGTNKKSFIIEKDKIIEYDIGQKIKTDQGEYTV